MTIPKPKKITGIQCTECLDKIFSMSLHDFVTCKCGKSHVDGGQRDYVRVLWDTKEPPIHIEEYVQ